MSKSPYRLLAIDFDGTLLSPESRVTAPTRTALHRAIDHGWHVVFATGRNHTESREILREAGCDSLCVFVTGAIVMNTRQNVVLQRRGIESKLACELCEVFEDAGHAALVLQDTELAGVDYFVSDTPQVNAETARWMKGTRAKVQRICSLADHPHEHTLRISVVADEAETQSLHDVISKRFDDRVETHLIGIPGLPVALLEVFGRTVNKWTGVEYVSGILGVGASEIVAIGDDLNDLPMLENAGLSAAMGNARPKVIQAAHQVIGANSEDGLARFVNRLVDGETFAARNEEAA